MHLIVQDDSIDNYENKLSKTLSYKPHSLGILTFPYIVYVFPAPVYPYANKQQLTPLNAVLMILSPIAW